MYASCMLLSGVRQSPPDGGSVPGGTATRGEGVPVPLLAFSPAGEVLPLRLSPSAARREVSRARARYVHAPGVAPHPRYGSVIVYSRRKTVSRPNRRVPVLNGDGTVIGWVRPHQARRYARAGYWRPVGDGVPADEARAVMFDSLLDAEALWRIACWDVWLAMDRAVQVGVLRRRLEALAEQDLDNPAVQAKAVQECLDWAARFGRSRGQGIETMEDLLALRQELQQVRSVNPIRDADFGPVRNLLGR